MIELGISAIAVLTPVTTPPGDKSTSHNVADWIPP
jgi:hypothetical protein